MRQVLMKVHRHLIDSKRMFFCFLPFCGIACLQYPTEDIPVRDMRLSYYVLAENTEEASISVRLHDADDIFSFDLILSGEDTLYIEHDGESYILDEEDNTKLINPDVRYTKKIPYSDITQPFTLVFDRPSGQYKTNLFLVNDFSVSVQNDEPFAFSSLSSMPLDVRWTSIQNVADVDISLRGTDCTSYSSGTGIVENTGQTQLELRFDDPIVQVDPLDLLCTVKVHVSAGTVGYSADFGEASIYGTQRRSSHIKVLYLP